MRGLLDIATYMNLFLMAAEQSVATKVKWLNNGHTLL